MTPAWARHGTQAPSAQPSCRWDNTEVILAHCGTPEAAWRSCRCLTWCRLSSTASTVGGSALCQRSSALLMQAMPRLTAADAAAAAGLVLRRMPREHAAIMHSLSSQPELQFRYLKVSVHPPSCQWQANLQHVSTDSSCSMQFYSCNQLHAAPSHD